MKSKWIPHYSDETMQDIFPLIISSFAPLTNKSTNLYAKGVRIIDIMAYVRFCITMLDLDCKHKMIDMFQYFLLTIKETYLGNIFTSIETIMTLILDEFDNISFDLITLLWIVWKRKKRRFVLLQWMWWKDFEKWANNIIPYLS